MTEPPDVGAPLRVVTADDHPTFLAGLRAVLAAAPDLALVGEAGTGAEAVALAGDLRPDVVVMDLQMPDLDGIEATRRLMTTTPSVRVLVVTMFEDDATVFRAVRAGARGYVLKGASFGELLRTIRRSPTGRRCSGRGWRSGSSTGSPRPRRRCRRTPSRTSPPGSGRCWRSSRSGGRTPRSPPSCS